jgi:hypothetical protein
MGKMNEWSSKNSMSAKTVAEEALLTILAKLVQTVVVVVFVVVTVVA